MTDGPPVDIWYYLPLLAPAIYGLIILVVVWAIILSVPNRNSHRHVPPGE
jgi:hypothetical protein